MMRKPDPTAVKGGINGGGSSSNTNKLRKGLWSPEEDDKLINYMLTNGQGYIYNSFARLGWSLARLLGVIDGIRTRGFTESQSVAMGLSATTTIRFSITGEQTSSFVVKLRIQKLYAGRFYGRPVRRRV
ncbi:hypothetical protein COLO4_09007 [Corchorus olitorius]|uniref:Myb-like domain-containing protein n=1 Tax=Corchorus olitorius TaxID=93759 RepID=A0A1R3KDJ1_9ROSI|nr:hypothetical protein COLO4_09007 [Corchorus olitorius]